MLCGLLGSQRLGLRTQILVLRLTEDDACQSPLARGRQTCGL